MVRALLPAATIAAALVLSPALAQPGPSGGPDSGTATTNPAGTQDKTNAGQPLSNPNTDDLSKQADPGLTGPRGANTDPGAQTASQSGTPSRVEPVLPQTSQAGNPPVGMADPNAPASADSSRPGGPQGATPSR